MAQPNVIVFSASDVDKIPMLADNNTFTGTNTFSGATVLNGALSGTSVKDEDNMVSDSATAVPTQQSVKAYVDGKTGFLSVRTETATYTVLTGDDIVVCNKTSAMTVNLPVASGSGRVLIISNINTGIVTVDGNSSDTIDGSATVNIIQWEALQIVDYATNAWVIV